MPRAQRLSYTNQQCSRALESQCKPSGPRGRRAPPQRPASTPHTRRARQSAPLRVQKASETPEERAARLEKEAYEAGERAKMAAVANLAALRERQEREAKYSRFNGIKIHNQWRKIMRMTTVDALRGQIEVHSQSHERQVDRKDAIIQMLDRDLEDAEEQHTVAVRGHMAIVAQLLDLQYQKAAAWQAAFEAGAAAAAGAFDAERADIAAAHARHKRDMAELVAAMKLSYGELESDMRQVRAPPHPAAPAGSRETGRQQP